MLSDSRGHLKRAAGVLEPTTRRYQFPTVAPVVSNPQACSLGESRKARVGEQGSALTAPMRLILWDLKSIRARTKHR